MSVDLANIIEKHRQDLMRRLLSRNTLLFFSPTVRNRIDACDLFPENALIVPDDNQTDDGISNPDDFLKNLANSGEDGAQIKINRIARQSLNLLNNLQDKAHDHYRSTGNWPLCLGWPLFYVPRGSRAPYIAPLLLWKIAINVAGNNATFKLYEKDAYFNFMLQAWHEQEYGSPFVWPNNDVPFEGLAEEIKERLKEWNLQGYGNNNCKFDGNLDAIKKYSKQDFDCPTVIPCATIGSANFNYQPLLEELKVLSKKAGVGEGLGLLKNLLSSETGKSKSTGSPNPPKEPGKWLIADSDLTQESSVWRAREEEIMLIDGPPGTGKSQTIVNLIADAAQRGGRAAQNGMKIALVCHKKPALDVVHKRLQAAGWQNIVAQINNPIEERQGFIRRVGDLPPVNPLFAISTSATSSREDLCNSIIENEDICKKSNVIGNYSIRGDLRAKIFRVNEENNFSPYNESLLDKFRRIIGNDIEQEQMNSLVEQCGTLADDWSSCNYSQNPWQEVQEDWPLDNQAPLAMAIGNLCKQYDEVKKLP